MNIRTKTEFDGEFKNCKKSLDFAGNNLIFYFSLFLGLKKPKFDDLTVKLKKRILKSLQVRTLLDLLPPKEFISCPCSRFRPLLPESGYFAESFR